MKILGIIFLSFLAIGCASPQFNIIEANTRLTNISGKITLSENNRISTKSVAGGHHIDSDGVFINPFVEKSDTSNKLLMTGFFILNKHEVTSIGGGPNALGNLQELNCLINNDKQVNLKISNQRSNASGVIGYNTIARYAHMDKQESGMTRLSLEQMKLFSEAEKITCRITGTRRSVIYDEKDISPQFIANIKRFYDEKIK